MRMPSIRPFDAVRDLFQTDRGRRALRGFKPGAGFVLEPRALLAARIVELSIPLARSEADSLVRGPDGNIWGLAETFDSATFKDKAYLVRFDAATGATKSYPIGEVAFGGTDSLTVGPNGTLWYLDGNELVQFTISTAHLKRYDLGESYSPTDAIAGPDGNMWFVTKTIDTIQVGKLSLPDGGITRYTVATNEPVNAPGFLSVGPDQRINFMWGSTFGSITTAGQFTSYPAVGASDIVFGPNNTAWTHHYFDDKVYQINPNNFSLIKSIDRPAGSRPWSMAFDTSGMLWVAEMDTNKLAKIDPATSQVTQISLPKTRNVDGILVPESPKTLVGTPDGNIWYSQSSAFSRIGVLALDGKGPSRGYVSKEGGVIPAALTEAPRVTSITIKINTKRVGRKTIRTFAGFALTFNVPMDAALAKSTKSYVLTANTKQGKQIKATPVPFQTSLSRDGKTLSILIDGSKFKFPLGGKLTTKSQLASAFGLGMPSRSFKIGNNARTIV